MGDVGQRIIVNPGNLNPRAAEPLPIVVGESFPVSKEAQRLVEAGSHADYGIFFDPKNPLAKKRVGAFYDVEQNNVVIIVPIPGAITHEITHAKVNNLSYADQSQLVHEVFADKEKGLETLYRQLAKTSPIYKISLGGDKDYLDQLDARRVQTGHGACYRATFSAWQNDSLVPVSAIAVIDELLAYNNDPDAAMTSFGKTAREIIQNLEPEKRRQLKEMDLIGFSPKKIIEIIKKLLQAKSGSGKPEINLL